MKFFQKTSVAVIFTVLMIAAALFIGLSPALKSEPVPEPMAQTTAQEQTASQTPAAEQTSNTAGDETISDKYIRDDAGLFTRSGENAIQDYNTKIYHKTGSHIAILTTDSPGGKTLESYTDSAFDSMGLSEYDMLFAIDTSTEQWYVTTGSYVADYTDSKLESIFQDGFAAILDGDADDAADTMYEELYSWCKSSLNGTANEDYTPVQETGRVRRKSMIGTIITILVIFWIIKAIFGSGRRGGGGGGFWSGLFLGSLFSNHHHHGPGPGPGPRPGPRPGGFGGGPRPGGGSRGGFGGGRGGFGGGRR
mgnify:CR=1 FL=1